MKKLKIFLVLLSLFTAMGVKAQVWQWSVPVKSVISRETNNHPQAFLWIPAGCKQVRGIIVGQHNMLEEGIFEHPEFRKALTAIGFAEVWISPALDFVFNFDKGPKMDSLMTALGKESGYTELEYAPIVPIGHSAEASYPWNFAAGNPDRTLAILSVHGDAPTTTMTGSGAPNPDWGNHNINGIPGLMVMGEYEWIEKRLDPALKYRNKHPLSPVSLLADAGHGHFDYSDQLVNYLAMFVTKAAKARLPENMPLNKPVVLKPVIPRNGWLADRWRRDSLPKYPSAPYLKYTGDTSQALWYFDKEMADATETYYEKARGKKNERIVYAQNGMPIAASGKVLGGIAASFMPLTDGLTFHIRASYADSLHATTPVTITRICGPVVKVNDTTFSVRFYRMGLDNPKRTGDIWLIATSNGDANYKSAAQPLDMHIPITNQAGADQVIDFPAIKDISQHVKTIRLNAKANQDLPVYYYVKDGPAEIVGDQLIIDKIPIRSKFPIKVTVVAWQYGRSIEPRVKSAAPVERVFWIVK